MTDIDAPSRYAQPAADQTGRGSNVVLVVALKRRSRRGRRQPRHDLARNGRALRACHLGGLAVVGVFCLFAGTVGTWISGKARLNDVTKAFVDNLPGGALIADQSGRVLRQRGPIAACSVSSQTW